MIFSRVRPLRIHGDVPLAVLLGLVAASTAAGAVITVDPAGGGDFSDLQQAIDAARNGDRILVLAGEYVISEPLDFNRRHDPSNPASPELKDIVLRSIAGPAATVIRVENRFPRGVIVFRKGESRDSVLEGFTLTGGGGFHNGWGYFGGAIYCEDSSPTIANCRIQGNYAFQGGGVYIGRGASPRLTDTLITGNSTTFETLSSGGGIYCSFDSSPMITACEITSNHGGGTRDLELESGGGGGVFLDQSTSAVLTLCTIAGNGATLGGGVAVAVGESSRPTLSSCTIRENVAFLGGGLALQGGRVKISRSSISGNVAAPTLTPMLAGGGGIFWKDGKAEVESSD